MSRVRVGLDAGQAVAHSVGDGVSGKTVCRSGRRSPSPGFSREAYPNPTAFREQHMQSALSVADCFDVISEFIFPPSAKLLLDWNHSGFIRHNLHLVISQPITPFHLVPWSSLFEAGNDSCRRDPPQSIREQPRDDRFMVSPTHRRICGSGRGPPPSALPYYSKKTLKREKLWDSDAS